MATNPASATAADTQHILAALNTRQSLQPSPLTLQGLFSRGMTEKVVELSSDLQSVLNNFIHLKEFCHEAQKQQAKMEKMVDQLQKELHECRAAEKAERTKLAESRHLLAMQQDSINKLLSVKAENAKLSETVKNQELKLRQLKSDLEQETFMWKQKMEVTCQEHARRLEEQRVALQQKGDRMSNELIHVRAQLKALQDEKNEKINLITQTKLLELEQKINSTATPTVQVDVPLQQSRWNSVELRETTEDGPAQLSRPAVRRSGVTFPAIRKRRLFTNNSLNCL
ncbi:spindle assembly abnormal protein 6 homolog isoform X2 [Schistocerca cancellata]|uniref:spindle assembly abnormal protein 6 homolog isoform X2 n=1 Tax=Schistocerca cancellata TaxID=274614 RepID=UPI0021178C1E|nr:spindle assembly abnormal protein 6 homolog isoform X2 [Schistocerca cancellata]